MTTQYKQLNNFLFRQKVLCIVVVSMLSMMSCKKYLDAKPDKALAVPSTLKDCQALLDNKSNVNDGCISFLSELVADNYYITPDNYGNLPPTEHDNYIWKTDAFVNDYWTYIYKTVLYANTVLEALDKISPKANEQQTWNDLKGAALFYRAFSFYHAAQIWTAPYDAATAGQDMGVPIKLTASITDIPGRGTLQETYDRIVEDLKTAITLLPDNQPTTIINKTRPNQATAHAMLARVYLTMEDYTKAKEEANNALGKYSTLMDYNLLSQSATFPIERFNPEMFYDATSPAFCLALYYAKVDSNLYNSYSSADLRKTIFFQDNGDNTFTFKGAYYGYYSYTIENGLATDEMYLTRAECNARANDVAAAMQDLNDLLRTRWQGTYTDITAANADDALELILTERRKELLFRGLRWTDLRRLNKDSRFATTLTRKLGADTYTLPPNDPRYTLLIPQDIIKISGMPQNLR